MKTLGKLKINDEKMLKNEELIDLKGGGYGNGCNDTCTGNCGYQGQGHCSISSGSCNCNYE